MEPKQYTVAWNTGCMGHLIKAIIGIEKYSIDFEHAGSDSHYIGHALHSLPIGHIHPFDPDKITAEANVIRPYFGDERLKYFPKYLKSISINENVIIVIRISIIKIGFYLIIIEGYH